LSSGARPAKALPLSVTLLLLAAVQPACSIRKYAINQVGDALSGVGTTFASDDDPELVGEALPFTLKLVEGLLLESPRHRGLLETAASGFTQYTAVYVTQPADEIELENVAKAEALRLRARKLFLRGRDYGLRGLELKHPGMREALRKDPQAAVGSATAAEVPFLYWTAAAWGLAISVSKNDPELIADQPAVQALIDRALGLDEDYDQGSIHGFLVTYEMSRPGGARDAAERSRKHFERAVELSGGLRAAPFVAFAEAVSVKNQDKKQFEALLQRALTIDIEKKPEWRLANLVMQRRARWLLSRVDDLILE